METSKNKNVASRRTGRAARPVRARKNTNSSSSSSNNGSDRKVTAPVAQGRLSTIGSPKFLSSKRGEVLISHREYVADILGSVNFKNDHWLINPGNRQLFTWLSSIAPQFESYLFDKLEFHFETSSPTTKQGAAFAAVDYDPSDTFPSSKAQLMAYRGAKRCPIWSESKFHCDYQDLRKRKTYFVSTNAATGDATTLCGIFNLATSGCEDDAMIGELYVDYTVRLMTPQSPSMFFGNYVSYRAALPSGVPSKAPSSNLDVLVDASLGGTNTYTIIFHEPFEGLVVLVAVGVAFGNNVTKSGQAATVTNTNFSFRNQASTEITFISGIRANALDNLVLEFNATSIASGQLTMIKADL